MSWNIYVVLLVTLYKTPTVEPEQSQTESNTVEQSQTKSNCNKKNPFDFVTVFDLVRLCSQPKSNQKW